MVQVFISYSHKDDIFAQELKRQIEGAGFDNWIDTEQLKVSTNWPEEIQKAIDASYALIVIKSPDSYDSPYVTSEWTYALRAGVPIIPILYKLQPTPHAWLEVNVIHHLNFTDLANRIWDELFSLLTKTRDQHGIQVRIPKDAPPNIRAALGKLNSPFPEDVLDGIKLLAHLQDPIAVSGLVITLVHENNDVINAAFQALIKIGDIAVPQLLEAFLKEHNNGDLEAHENKQLRIASILGQINSDEALAGLLAAIHDARERLRYFALVGISQMQRIEATPRLLELIHDPYIAVRETAIVALANIGGKDAVDGLIEALKDVEKDIRSTAAGNLGVLGDPIAVPALINALSDPEWRVRVDSAYALGRIGDPDPGAINGLFSLSMDEHDGVRQAGLDALNTIYNRTGASEAMEAIKKWPKPPENN